MNFLQIMNKKLKWNICTQVNGVLETPPLLLQPPPSWTTIEFLEIDCCQPSFQKFISLYSHELTISKVLYVIQRKCISKANTKPQQHKDT
jgi:hypothetical protein